MTLEEAIKHAEEVAEKYELVAFEAELQEEYDKITPCKKCATEHRQLAEWLTILKKAKFEYNEAWRIITHPTPDVTYADKKRAQAILDTFKNSLGKLDAERRTDE